MQSATGQWTPVAAAQCGVFAGPSPILRKNLTQPLRLHRGLCEVLAQIP